MIAAWPYWYYLRVGTVKHALPYAAAKVSICRMAPPLWDYWYGTGSQVEYERVAALPACKRCLARGYRP